MNNIPNKLKVLGNALFLWVIVLCLLPTKSNFAQNLDSNVPNVIKMAESVMNRHTYYYGKWDYVTGTVLKSFQELWLATGDEKYYNYIKNTVDYVVDNNGNIDDYDISKYNIDEIREGSALLFLYEQTGKDKYKQAAETLMGQLNNQPRTSQGGFWHKQRYPNQMWLDGLYMGSPFYAQYAKVFNNPDGFNDVVNQIKLMNKHIKDTATGLYYHGWDESLEQDWADPVTGVSSEFWGRGMGWYAMAIVDILDYLPSDHQQRDTVITIFSEFIAAISNYQDAETGLWWQIVDKGGQEGNYREASSSCMFVYAMAKAARLGYVDELYREVALKGYNGIVDYLITEVDGILNLNHICRSAGLGYGRDGSYNYYIYETDKVSNDGKGIGPFILAALEFDTIPEQTGIGNAVQQGNFVEVYPNPANEQFVVKINGPISRKSCRVKILNVIGQPVMWQTVDLTEKQEFVVPSVQLKNGLYFLQLQIGDNSISKRFMISHN